MQSLPFPPADAICAFPYRLEQVDTLATTWRARRRHMQENHGKPDATVRKMPGQQGIA